MTEYIQPTNPIRVWQSGDSANYCHHVFAMVISDEREVEFMTVNGMVLPRWQIMYAEVLLEGRWQAIHSHDKTVLDTH